MASVTRVNGYQSSDGKIFKTEGEAIDQEQYLTVYAGIKKLLDDNQYYDSRVVHAISYILAMNRHPLYHLLKDNI